MQLTLNRGGDLSAAAQVAEILPSGADRGTGLPCRGGLGGGGSGLLCQSPHQHSLLDGVGVGGLRLS
jgi:hypothetical protein